MYAEKEEGENQVQINLERQGLPTTVTYMKKKVMIKSSSLQIAKEVTFIQKRVRI